MKYVLAVVPGTWYVPAGTQQTSLLWVVILVRVYLVIIQNVTDALPSVCVWVSLGMFV